MIALFSWIFKTVLQYNHRDVTLANLLDTALTWGSLTCPQKPFSYGVNDLTFIFVTHASILTPVTSKQSKTILHKYWTLRYLLIYQIIINNIIEWYWRVNLVPVHLRRMRPRLLSCYAFFKWWTLPIPHQSCIRLHTSLITLVNIFGALTHSLGCFPLVARPYHLTTHCQLLTYNHSEVNWPR